MFREGSGPALEDVLLNDHLLFEFSPAESMINFDIPNSQDNENDWHLCDLDFNCDPFVGVADRSKNDFTVSDTSPLTFDFADLDKNFDFDDYLLEALNSDLSSDTPQSRTDSSDNEGQGNPILLNRDSELMCPDYLSIGNDWETEKRQEEVTGTVKVPLGQPTFCPELGAFRCPVEDCGKLYAKASHVRAHLRRHSGEKPYRCTWGECSWKFARSDELARHRRSHSGDKPYSCNECDKKFARSDHLAKHGRVHARRRAAAAAASRRVNPTHTFRTRRLI